jgi:hypothetical protein
LPLYSPINLSYGLNHAYLIIPRDSPIARDFTGNYDAFLGSILRLISFLIPSFFHILRINP